MPELTAERKARLAWIEKMQKIIAAEKAKRAAAAPALVPVASPVASPAPVPFSVGARVLVSPDARNSPHNERMKSLGTFEKIENAL